ncbi:MAG: serine hydrolase, partial [Bacteroidota bacterium]
QNKSFAQGYQREGNTLNPITFTTINGSPSGDFCSNAKDMATYLQFMLRRDTILFSKDEFNRIETPKTSLAAKNGLQFGYGLGNYTIWKNGFLFHGHGGEIDGFASRYVYSPEADLGVAIAINRNGNANAIVDEILNYLLGNDSSKERKTYPIPESLKSKFSGFYEFKSPKNQLLSFSDELFGGFIVEFQKDILIRKRIFGRPKDTLYYAGNNQFYFGKESIPSAMFIESDTKKFAFWINDSYTEKESRTRRLIIIFGLLFSFIFMALFFIYSLIWLIKNSFSKNRKKPTNHLILFGAVGSFLLMFIGFGLTLSNPESAMNIKFSSLLMFISSYALVLFSAMSIYRWFKLPSVKSFKLFYILTSIGAIAITIYLWDIGFIGLKLWSY